MARRPLSSPTGKPKALAPVFPNCGLEVQYRRKLSALIAEMAASLEHWISAAYRRNPPRMAQDEVPAQTMAAEMRRLGDRWLDRFDRAAPELGRWFATAAVNRSDAALRDILRRGGFSVRFQMTPEVRDVFKATLEQQVGLIKSIATEHLADVQGAVMRSVQAGHDLGTLTKQLQERYSLSKNRAATIARHQNNLANATITRARQTELGITTATWLHSGGGKHPRPSHVAQSGKPYEIATGWFDPDERAWVRPGELINCRCVSKSIIPGL